MTGVFALFLSVCFTSGVLGFECGQDVLDRLAAVEKTTISQQKEIRVLKDRLEEKESESRQSRALQNADDKISFTAYMANDLDQLAFSDTIVFDTVLHNDGNAYDNVTGVFTAPKAGVYFFTYFIGERDENQVNTMLTKNRVNYVDVLAEGIQVDHNDQSGNAATMRLAAGDNVEVVHRHVGNHIEGNTGVRLTTFSGFLLYADAEEVSVGIIG